MKGAKFLAKRVPDPTEMRVLLIEDDPELSAVMHQVLSAAGFTVAQSFNGRDGLDKALAERYGLIVLDLMLPKLDGLRVCAELRARRKTTPILMVTAKDSIADLVLGLETGADDYLGKPFDVREFLARIHALLRRDRLLKSRHLVAGPIRLDTRQRTASVASERVPLTRVEYGVLECLVSQLGRVVARETLLETVWQDQERGSNKLEVAVRSLRRKLAEVGLDDMIETVYGAGYSMHRTQEEVSEVVMGTKP